MHIGVDIPWLILPPSWKAAKPLGTGIPFQSPPLYCTLSYLWTIKSIFLQLWEALIFCTLLESEGPSGTMCHHFDGILETLTLSRPTCMFFRHLCRLFSTKDGKQWRGKVRDHVFHFEAEFSGKIVWTLCLFVQYSLNVILWLDESRTFNVISSNALLLLFPMLILCLWSH